MSVHFRIEQQDDGIVWLHFDMNEQGTNVLTKESLEDLDQSLISIAQLHPKGLIILSDKKNGFIAGADVKAFAKVTNEQTAKNDIRRAHHIFARLENFRFPTVAMIHGFCLGGGTELALACDYRVADSDSAKIGLPEVLLGIFPGFGGTARATRVMGSFNAMNMMLSGRAMNARIAKRQGLVDLAVPARQLKSAARQLINNQPTKRKPAWWNNILSLTPVRMLVAPLLRKQVAKRVKQEHYPAPYQLIEHWERHGNNFDAMLHNEIDTVASLICSDTAQNLIRVFLLRDQLKSAGKQSSFSASHVHVIGGGIMGGDIAAWCALRGLTVTLQDRTAEHLQTALKRANKLFKKKLKIRHKVQSATDRLIPDVYGHGAKQADVIIEAIYEDTAAKKDIYATLEPIIKPDAILATNTSSIPLETLSEDLEKPERLVGIHFFNPVAKMQLVEIVTAQHTAANIINDAAAFALQIDRLPLIVKSSPGFLINRILMPYLLEAVTMLNDGVSATMIDDAATDFGMPMGPIELADTVGLDICLSVANKLSESFPIDIPDILVAKVNQGNIGKKSGIGFYTWKKGKKIPTNVTNTTSAQTDIIDRLILRFLNEAIACLHEQVVENPDLLDAGVIFGTGFAPFHGGPMHYINNNGINTLEHRLHNLAQRYGDRFKSETDWKDTLNTPHDIEA